MPLVFISLGSNIDPETNLPRLAQMLRERFPAIRFSSVYRSAAVGFEGQADFLNAVAELQTEEAPETVLRALQEIEQSIGKAIPFRFGPRTGDLDLLLYDDVMRNDGALILPHPRMHERRFVLEPLLELINPQTRHPALGRAWGELLQESAGQRCERIILHL